MTYLYKLLYGLWQTVMEMAPFLLVGFLIAGILSVLVSRRWVERHLAGRGLWPVMKACLFGIPLPLCSCGVIPVAASFYRHGASRASTSAFLLATPQTGVDSILVTHSLLGPVFAVYRAVVALLTGLLGGVLVGAVDSDNAQRDGLFAPSPATSESDRGTHNRFTAALRHGFFDLPQDLARPMIIGIIIAGIISAALPEQLVEKTLGAGFGSMLLMMAIGVPAYVCATASVPIAAALIAKGASLGAVLVFLVTGPATNAAAITIIWKVMGRRTAIVYLGTVAVTALAAGALLDRFEINPIIAMDDHAHGMISTGVRTTLAVVLLGVLAVAAFRPAWPFEQRGQAAPAAGAMTLAIGGMTCGDCVASVRQALSECSGVNEVNVDLNSGRASVAGDNVKTDELCEAVESLGYRVISTGTAES